MPFDKDFNERVARFTLDEQFSISHLILSVKRQSSMSYLSDSQDVVPTDLKGRGVGDTKQDLQHKELQNITHVI